MTGSSLHSPADPDIGYGEAPTEAELRWIDGVKELTGPAALVRVAMNARATVGTVALVGTVLGALGLVSLPGLRSGLAATWLVVAAALTAITSVVLALLYLALRVRRINVEDLAEVQKWYAKQLDRIRYAIAASWLLLLAVVLAGTAAAVALLHGPEPVAALGFQISGRDAQRSLNAQVTVDGLAPGDTVTVQVLGLPSGPCPGAVVLKASSSADGSGKAASTSGTVANLPCNDEFRLEVGHAGRMLGSMTVP